VIQLTSRFTVAQMLAREDFNNRYTSGRPIAITELLYPLLQAYDSVIIEADIEFGGVDQKFNLLVGRELQGMMGQPPQQLLLVPLLVGTDGSQKMSKSLGNCIGVAEPPQEIYGKVMSIPDSLIIDYFTLVTDVPDGELTELNLALKQESVNPMALKKRLARDIVTQLYDATAATDAEQHFAQVVQRKEAPDTMPVVHSPDRTPDIRRLLASNNLVASISEATRLINQGAVKIDGKRISNFDAPVENDSIIQVGKRLFVRVIISSS